MGQMMRVLLCVIFLIQASASALAQPSPPATAPAAGAPTAAASKEEAVNFTIENSLSIRDPFHKPSPTGDRGDINLIPELERYDLDKFQLIGVITGPHHPKAMVTTPGGKMFVVDEATRIGTRRGVVKRIAPGEIIIEEKVINLLGQEESIETPIEFKEKKKEKEGL